MLNYRETNYVFYSPNNCVLGGRLKDVLRKIGLEIKYCKEYSDLINIISNTRDIVIFVDKFHNKSAEIISKSLVSDIKFLNNVRMVYVDDNLCFYEKYINNINFFCIPETNLETAVYNIVTRCELLNYRKIEDSVDYVKVNELISDYLLRLGFSYKLIGFKFIKQSLEQAIKNNFTLGSLARDVYPFVAINNATNITNVERGIRTSIDYAYKSTKFEVDGFDVLKNHNISNRFLLEYLLDKIQNDLSRKSS